MAIQKKLVVIGGGAAGFFCAVNAARLHKNFQVIIIEKSSKLLSKVKISGGGRCNVTHACFNVSDLVKKYPRGEVFLKKSFHQFSTNDTINWFEERGVQLKTEEDGRMFPVTNNSQTIIDCLLGEAAKYNIAIMMNTTAVEIKKVVDANDSQFEIIFSAGKKLMADKICIACGGYPKSIQYEWLSKLGHQIESPVPSLFTFNVPNNDIVSLMGLTVNDVVIKIIGSKLQQNGPLLITHWGFSGPAVLKLSAWSAIALAQKNYEFSILINWLPQYNENSLREKIQSVRFAFASQKINNRNPFGLPSRLWTYLLMKSDINESIRWADLPSKEQNKLIKNCCAQEFQVKGKTTFKEEFVTAGGIKLNEVNANTLESNITPGLFFAGEILNIDGVTGGFNFQNAWTTGWIAAQHIGN